jgi:UDP-glucose 4-epimerase
MKILVTGAAGFIGLRFAHRLAEMGSIVHMVDMVKPPVNDKDFHEVIKKPNVKFFELNGLNDHSLQCLDNDYTHVAHFAALLGVQNVLDAPFDVLDYNHRLTSNFLNFAKSQKAQPRFLFASTSEVYAGTLASGSLTIPSPEGSQIILPPLSQPRSSYMLSKIYGEAMCINAGIPFTIVRPHNIYGPRMGMRHVIPQLLQRAYKSVGTELTVFSPTHTRTFCFIDDAVKMLVLLIKSDDAVNKTLNLGNQSPEITMKNLAETIIEQVGSPVTVKPSENTAGSPSRRAPNMEECSNIIGYIEQTSLSDGVKKTFEWYRDNYF